MEHDTQGMQIRSTSRTTTVGDSRRLKHLAAVVAATVLGCSANQHEPLVALTDSSHLESCSELPFPSDAHATFQDRRVLRLGSVAGHIQSQGGGDWPEGYGAVVVIRTLDGSILGQTRTEPSGYFSFAEIGNGRYCLQISEDGWVSVILQLQISETGRDVLDFKLPLDT